MPDFILNPIKRFGGFRVAQAATLVLLLGMAGCKQAPAPDTMSDTAFDASFLEDGKLITEKNCLGCHSVDLSEESPRPDAPSLSTVLASYNPNTLADDFREHVHVGHPDMPDFDFNVKETEGLLAYLSSIQEPKSPEP